MIFRRAVVAELATVAGAVFTILFSIVLSVGLVRLLGEAAAGRVDNEAVFGLVVLTALTWLPLLLALTVFIAVIMTLARAFLESEMVVWFASGQSLFAWLAPVLRFALPVVILIAVLAAFVSPWANRQIIDSRDRFLKRDDVSKVAPGRFIESAGADRVFFIEAADLDAGRIRNIFVSQRTRDAQIVVVAAQGVIEETDTGDRYLVLERGRRYEGKPGQPEYRMMEFERLSVRLDARRDAPLGAQRASARPTAELLAERSRANEAELLWRISMPLAALLLAIAAVPLAYTNPRVGRSGNLIIAVLLFFCYLNGINLVQSYVLNGRLPLALALPLPHLAVALLAAVLFVRRVYLPRWLPGWLSPGYWIARRAAA